MSVLAWILGILAIPTVAVLAWLGTVFVKEFRRSLREENATVAYELPAASAALGLLPQDQQNTKAAGPTPAVLTAAVAAAEAGDWKPAAALLQDTGKDWERRAVAVARLATAAAEDDTWLLAWESEHPDSPDAAVLRARSTVFLAWNIRGGKRARYTTGEQFDGFHRTLERSREENARAAALSPDDPIPYVGEIWTALGLGLPHAHMDRLWDRLTALAPHHYEAHFGALQYWCAKWRGSHEQARDFAAPAAASAPLGSLLTAFPLIAWFEHYHDGDTPQDAFRTTEVTALVDAALSDAAVAPADHPRLPEVRHLLAYFLTMQDRDEASVEQFRLVDGYVDALPWRYDPDPAKEYCRLRDITVANAT